MILRDIETIVVHIPKTAGSSLRELFGRRLPTISEPPDYDLVHGWDPVRKRLLQHLTLAEMREYGFITDHEIDTFFKIAVVRNPYDRVVSAFHFNRRDQNMFGTFDGMLDGTGTWSKVMNDRDSRRYRGEMIRPQRDFLLVDGELAVDHLGRFEDIGTTFSLVEERMGATAPPRSHRKRIKKQFPHYSMFYSDDELARVAGLVADDLTAFGYEFDDRRDNRSRQLRVPRRLRAGLADLPEGCKKRAVRVRRKLRS